VVQHKLLLGMNIEEKWKQLVYICHMHTHLCNSWHFVDFFGGRDSDTGSSC